MSSLASIAFLRPTIAHILRSDPDERGWSVQGFGMMRTYVGPPDNPKEYRLNIWDSELAVPDVSTIHDHPWHFDSTIIGGAFVNQRYDMVADMPPVPGQAESPLGSNAFAYTVIRTGEGGGLEKAPIRHALLKPRRPELYSPGAIYGQESTEIHETIYSDGCITLNKRVRVGDGEHARVFWPAGTDWVDAEPRAATDQEIRRTLSKALGLL